MIMEIDVKDDVQSFVHNENVTHYKKLIAGYERDPLRDGAQLLNGSWE